jgi:ketosteroid isomerase-like protein
MTDSDLKRAVECFVDAVDRGDAAALATTYSPDFLNIRVADDGGLASLTGAEILSILKISGEGKHTLPIRETVIHLAEIVGHSGYVLMTRIKDLGNGWEPMFHSLVWGLSGHGKWLLLREFVHQKAFPKLS